MQKEELLELLKQGSIEEFNNSRQLDKENLLDLSEADFSGCTLSEANLSYADLSGSDFSECDLYSVDFTGSDLSTVEFKRANVTKSDFSKTTLAGTKFNHATVNNSDFSDADLSGTVFSEATLSDSEFASAENIELCIFDSDTVWPDSQNLPDEFIPEYVEDLSSLRDEDDYTQDEYAY